jgi:FixJ family two-component response regulator
VVPSIIQRIGRLPENPVISIVDDDDSVRASIDSLVRSLGFTAHSFASADAFLRSPQLAQTKCLISDVQMPNISGIELQNILITQGSSIPIIFITAFPDEAVEKTAMQAGAICFLNKPFDGQVMIKCLYRAMALGQ